MVICDMDKIIIFFLDKVLQIKENMIIQYTLWGIQIFNTNDNGRAVAYKQHSDLRSFLRKIVLLKAGTEKRRVFTCREWGYLKKQYVSVLHCLFMSIRWIGNTATARIVTQYWIESICLTVIAAVSDWSSTVQGNMWWSFLLRKLNAGEHCRRKERYKLM